MDEWHYLRGETTFGPISGAMLHSLIKRGRLQGGTQVRRSGESEWSTATQVLPALPPVPDAPSMAQDSAQAELHYDSSLPGASEIYAPPRSTNLMVEQFKLPVFLWFSLLLILASFAYTACSYATITLIQLSFVSDPSSWPEWLQLLSRHLAQKLGYNHLGFSMLVGILTAAFWQGCAFASLRELYGDMVRRSRISGLWWFVPFANLAMPLLCLRDMRYLSRVKRDFLHSHASFGPLLITFEVLLLLRLPMAVITSLNAHSYKDRLPSGGQVFVLLFNSLSLFALAFAFILIVVTNFRQQRRLFAHWDDKDYWDKHRHD